MTMKKCRVNKAFFEVAFEHSKGKLGNWTALRRLEVTDNQDDSMEVFFVM